jgi:hypothetical protein
MYIIKSRLISNLILNSKGITVLTTEVFPHLPTMVDIALSTLKTDTGTNILSSTDPRIKTRGEAVSRRSKPGQCVPMPTMSP